MTAPPSKEEVRWMLDKVCVDVRPRGSVRGPKFFRDELTDQLLQPYGGLQGFHDLLDTVIAALPGSLSDQDLWRAYQKVRRFSKIRDTCASTWYYPYISPAALQSLEELANKFNLKTHEVQTALVFIYLWAVNCRDPEFIPRVRKQYRLHTLALGFEGKA